MTKIKFYSGLKEIGGTVVAVETGKAICIFDFGFAYAARIDDKLKTRAGSEVSDYIKLGVLNRLDGVYEKEVSHELGLKGYGEIDKKIFVIISHMHIDHMGGLGALAPELPVYMSRDSMTLYREMGVTGELEIREHKNILPMDYDASINIEDIKVTCIQVDHDVIGACGFMIETEDGKIAYTGDYRLHGYHPQISRDFAEKCKGVDYLISEGVTVSFDDVDILSLEGPVRTNSEWTLLDDVEKYAVEEEGLIVINNYNRNVERMHHMIEKIHLSGREVLLDEVQGSYIAAFYPQDDFKIYLPEGGTPAFSKVKDKEVITRKELFETPSKYVLQQDYKDSYELFDIHQCISLYLHMDGAPLGNYDPSYDKLYAMLEVLGINVIKCGLGGHAEPYCLRNTIDIIAPSTLIPLHSFRPEQLKSERAKEIILPEPGDEIVFTK